MSHDLSKYNIVVTGGTGVMGSVFVKAIVEHGGAVGIVARDAEKINGLIDEVKDTDNVISLESDVLDVGSLKKAKEKFNNKFGKIDVLINCAGGNHSSATTDDEYHNSKGKKTFFDLEEEGIDYVFDLNYKGTLLPSQVFGEDIVESDKGSVINISSMNAILPLTKIPAYSGAKAAISNFTQWLSTYFEGGVRVNAVAPGFFETNQNKNLLRNNDGSYSKRAEKIVSQTPMKRFGKPEELIGVLLWLIDETASSFVTGAVIPIDGGFSSYSGV